jgi:hypothetical protein
MPLLYHDMTISFDHAAVEQLPVVLSKWPDSRGSDAGVKPHQLIRECSQLELLTLDKSVVCTIPEGQFDFREEADKQRKL